MQITRVDDVILMENLHLFDEEGYLIKAAMLTFYKDPGKLFKKHSSKPYNPKLANVFFKSGMIEAWGRGFDKIKEACTKYDGRLPEYNISASGIMVLCKACDKYLELLSGNENDSLISNERINERKDERADTADT